MNGRINGQIKRRLTEWAKVFRSVMMHGAPHPNCYSKSAFVDGRIDHEQVRQFLEFTENVEAALQVDEWLQRLRGMAPNCYTAILIHYVEREPGGLHRLTRIHRIRRWHSRTGLGRAWYYHQLRQGEWFVGKMMAYEESLTSLDKNHTISGSLSQLPPRGAAHI